MKTTIAFLGTKEIGYECLKYLIEKSSELNCTVSYVLTKFSGLDKSSNETVYSLAKDYGIRVLEHTDEMLQMEKVDIILSVQYHQILRRKHIDQAKKIAVNLHMAPLPEYRGCNQFSFAIINNDTEFGTTLHGIDEGVDSGDILFEKRFAIPKGCFVNDLYKITFDQSIVLFKESLDPLINGNYQPIKQSSFEGKRSFSFHKRSEMSDLKEIDLNWDQEKINRHIRACSMPGFPPPFTTIEGRKINFVLED